MICFLLVGIIFVILGIFIFLKPYLIWNITEKWKSYRADEPSDLYVMSTKFGGVLFVLFGIAMIVLQLILE